MFTEVEKPFKEQGRWRLIEVWAAAKPSTKGPLEKLMEYFGVPYVPTDISQSILNLKKKYSEQGFAEKFYEHRFTTQYFDGLTILQIAVLELNASLVAGLLRDGADPSIRSENNHTVFDIVKFKIKRGLQEGKNDNVARALSVGITMLKIFVSNKLVLQRCKDTNGLGEAYKSYKQFLLDLEKSKIINLNEKFFEPYDKLFEAEEADVSKLQKTLSALRVVLRALCLSLQSTVS